MSADKQTPQRSMWADESEAPWLVALYVVVLFGTPLLCHACRSAA
jgi:hypothetical protein